MGNCSKGQIDNSKPLAFHQKVTIKIKKSDEGKSHREPTSFSVIPPLINHKESLRLNSITYQLSACVLPQFDPRSLVHRDCQDSLFTLEHNNTILLVLFDGHGKTGCEIVKHCSEFMKSYFTEHFSDFINDPESAIESIMQDCDFHLRNSTSINTSLSGATAVVVFINHEDIHIGSVGDSHAVLGTTPNTNEIRQPIISKTNKYVRPLLPSKDIRCIPLTTVQKPNHDVEYERIKKNGGKVMQLTNDDGKPFGPYRVWQANMLNPGLRISRSIGDSIAKTIGVIATPIYNHFKLMTNRDKFIVVASDGVWDVMEENEVVDFVEKYRTKCAGKNKFKEYPCTVINSHIAQFLAEEARYRWYGICEEEDVVIDDISVIVLELETMPMSFHSSEVMENAENRKTVKFQSIAIAYEGGNSIISDMYRSGADRRSIINSVRNSENLRRVDAKRRSYVSEENVYEIIENGKEIDDVFGSGNDYEEFKESENNVNTDE